MTIFLAWSGCIGGLRAVQASASGMWEYADVHASLCIKLSSATDDFCLRKNNKKEDWKKYDGGGGSGGSGGEVMIMIILIITHATGASMHGTLPTNTPNPCRQDYHKSKSPFLCLNFVLFY